MRSPRQFAISTARSKQSQASKLQSPKDRKRESSVKLISSPKKKIKTASRTDTKTSRVESLSPRRNTKVTASKFPSSVTRTPTRRTPISEPISKSITKANATSKANATPKQSERNKNKNEATEPSKQSPRSVNKSLSRGRNVSLATAKNTKSKKLSKADESDGKDEDKVANTTSTGSTDSKQSERNATKKEEVLNNSKGNSPRISQSRSKGTPSRAAENSKSKKEDTSDESDSSEEDEDSIATTRQSRSRTPSSKTPANSDGLIPQQKELPKRGQASSKLSPIKKKAPAHDDKQCENVCISPRRSARSELKTDGTAKSEVKSTCQSSKSVEVTKPKTPDSVSQQAVRSSRQRSKETSKVSNDKPIVDSKKQSDASSEREESNRSQNNKGSVEVEASNTKTRSSGKKDEAVKQDEAKSVPKDNSKKDTKPNERNVSNSAKGKSALNAQMTKTKSCVSSDLEEDPDSSVVELDASDEDPESAVQEISRTEVEDSVTVEDIHIDRLKVLHKELHALKTSHAVAMKKNEEECQCLQNELSWKDEQLAEMGDLMSANIELESRISSILSDQKVYAKERKKFCKSKGDTSEKQKSAKHDDKDKKPEKATKHKSPTTVKHLKKQNAETDDAPSSEESKGDGEANETPKPIEEKKGKAKMEKQERKSESKMNVSSAEFTDEESDDDSDVEETVTRRSKRNRKGSESPEKVKPSKKVKKEKAVDNETKSPKKKVAKSDETSESDEESEEEQENATKRKQRKRKSKPSDDKTKGKKTRKSKRTKKEKEFSVEEEDIDALFVSEKEDADSDGVQIIDDPDKAKEDTEKDEEEEPKMKEEEQLKSPEKDTEEDEDDEDKDGKGRHNIRKLMTGKKLTEETKAAAKAEKDRRERVDKEHERHLVEKEIDPETKIEICTKLVLAFKPGTKKALVEVIPRLVKKLKPHQVEAVEFMWDNLIESLDKLTPTNLGQGCILAHCMGLGKTLSVIALVHTLLTTKAVSLKTCLVVCPLNTVLNWQYEWQKWLDKQDRVPTYELASCRGNHSRADLLTKWQKSGGIMIIGYSLFRILSSYTGKSKKVKATFDESLLDPGPDLVICDEGHILKNDASALSKWMSKIRSQRRVVLTGTPLQNNLIEYHCMANFVKPQLLGTRREFSNRFVNPITNGQHSDSTGRDVKLMKRRAHVLHEMLAGCVQRRDYSALSKFLPPKEEYVISVRLSPLQVKLYHKYLETFRAEENQAANQTHTSFKIRGASLFTDYQALMRVWTHPWVLKLDALRQERKVFAEQDDELDSLDDTTDGVVSDTEEVDSEEEEGLVIDTSDQSSTETSDASRSRPKRGKAVKPDTEDVDKKKQKKVSAKQQRKRKKVNGKASKAEVDGSAKISETESSAESDFEKTKVLGGEVIRTWKTTSRHGKQVALNQDDLMRKDTKWWSELVDEELHKTMVELSGKLVLLFEILRMAQGLGDKVLVFSQSILSLDLIEEFLKYKDEDTQKYKGKKSDKPSRWVKDEDYYRMDGSTGAQNRRKFTSSFNTDNNDRLRLFLISTRAGGLGINLDSANRVIIFDASWNPSHDIQSIFRVYRFGQEKDVYVYRFVAQGTMEEKIYDRQVSKETLSQRVIDEHQIDRHFTANDLQELYIFKPDNLEDPDRVPPPVPKVPKDLILAELLSSQKDWIYGYHEHDSLLENRPEENLSEEERKAAWDEYERDKLGLMSYNNYNTQPSRLPLLPQYLPNIIPPVGGPATAQLSSLLTRLTPYSQPQVNMQIQQLPRVVKEILKYNPNITAEELQVRLQSFLGMHTRFSLPSSTFPQNLEQLKVQKILKDDGKTMFRVSITPSNNVLLSRLPVCQPLQPASLQPASTLPALLSQGVS